MRFDALKFKVGQKIAWYHHSRGRGDHPVAFGTVDKINRKSIIIIEEKPSYAPGTRWTLNKEWLEQEDRRASGWDFHGYNQFEEE